ncbi:tail fiber protein [Photorhabdus thracensis]|nr:tail fiber protein [Photorhabdus thracensis]
MNYFSNLPGIEYQGVFSTTKASYAKGINFGIVNYDTGRIYVNAYGDLYAHFLNGDGAISGGIVNTYPVGAPIPWPQPNPPSGYLACNGQSFDKSKYPQLAIAYPSGVLPDLRGEFIRGWDDGRGVDSGRGILSWQADELKAHSHSYQTIDEPGQGRAGGTGGKMYQKNTAETGGNETRPRNIAFNYIVRAA